MKRYIRYLGSSAAVMLGLAGGLPAGSAPPTLPRETAAAPPASALPPPATRATDPAAAQAQSTLTVLRARIAALTTRLGAELKERDAQGARLRAADLEITVQHRRLDGLRAAQLAVERRHAELLATLARQQTALDAERAALASQVRAAYMMGRQEQLELLLNQNDPAAAGRLLAYYGYFARGRADEIARISERSVRLEALKTDIEQTGAALQGLRADTRREMAGLLQARQAHAAALAAAIQTVDSGSRQLAELKRQEQAKEALVADLSQVLEDFPVDARQNFDALRGKLPWPVAGKLSARYQTPRPNAAQSGLRWNGVLIDAARGAKVRAPYFGRVVYADWLQGLGLLLIIGHSGNYMTLYGHAEVLYKSVGDWVAPGDIVAGMSDSAGAAPQLYFEIRAGRRTVDPKAWLKAAP